MLGDWAIVSLGSSYPTTGEGGEKRVKSKYGKQNKKVFLLPRRMHPSANTFRKSIGLTIGTLTYDRKGSNFHLKNNNQIKFKKQIVRDRVNAAGYLP